MPGETGTETVVATEVVSEGISNEAQVAADTPEGEATPEQETDLFVAAEALMIDAEARGMDANVINEMSKDDIIETYNKGKQPLEIAEDVEETEGEADGEAETAKSEDMATAPETVQEPAPQATPEQQTTPEEPTMTKREQDQQAFISRLQNENAQMRQQQTQVQPYLDAIQAPGMQEHMKNYYTEDDTPVALKSNLPELDPYDPASLKAHMKAEVREEMMATQRRTAQVNAATQKNNQLSQFSYNVEAGKQRLIANGVAPEVADQLMTNYWNRFITGDIATLAVNHHNAANSQETMKAEIEKARKEGADEALRKINTKQTTAPKRARPSGANAQQTAQKPLNDMSPAEMVGKLKNLKIDSPEYKRISNHMDAMLAKEEYAAMGQT